MKFNRRVLLTTSMTLLMVTGFSEAAIVQWKVNVSSSITAGETLTGYFDIDAVTNKISSYDILLSGIANRNVVKSSGFVAAGYSLPSSFSFRSSDPGGVGAFTYDFGLNLNNSVLFAKIVNAGTTAGFYVNLSKPFSTSFDGSVSSWNVDGSPSLLVPSNWQIGYPTKGVLTNISIGENDLNRGSITYNGLVSGTPPVPEPETYAMLLAGLGLIGAAVKRRSSVQS